MPVTKIKSKWTSGNLEFTDNSGNVIVTYDSANRKLTIPSGSKIDLSAATGALVPATGEILQADLGSAILDGTAAKVVADDNIIGGLPVLHRVDIADAASGNVEVTLTHKTRVVDVWVVKTGADGHATEDTIVVGAGASAITEAMAIGLLNDTGITRAGTIDDANHEIAAAGALRVTWVKGAGGGNNTACTVYVLGIRVA